MKTGVLLLLFFIHCCFLKASSHLVVDPSFLLLEEDFPLNTPIPVTICTGKVKIIEGDPAHTFSVSSLNDTCSTLKLNKHLDADKENADGSRWESFSLVFQGPKKSRATLEIQIVDVNDNAPVFINSPTVLTVPENTEEGTVLTELKTWDPDTGINGMASFSVDNDLFSVDKRKCTQGKCTTKLRLKGKLDFEQKRSHQVRVTARDGDPHRNESLHTEIEISVQVKDVQDVPPVFVTDLSQVFLVDAGASIDQVVFEVRARDGDEAADTVNKIVYGLEENEWLEIERETGNVKLTAIPTEPKDIRIAVTAKEDDEIGMKTDGEVRVKFLITSTEPTIELTTVPPKSDAQVVELCPNGTVQWTIKEGADQFDVGGTISLPSSEDPAAVKLYGFEGVFEPRITNNNSVEIVVKDKEAIDYEKLKKYTLHMSLGVRSCRIVIGVSDVNDNSPKFTEDNFLFYLNENANATKIGDITATDPDSTVFGPVEYSIVGHGKEIFNISENGTLFSTTPVDREEDPQFSFSVRATDKGGRFTDVPVKVIIKDENDNKPVFESKHFIIDVIEEIASKHKIAARDADLGENALLTYTLSGVPSQLPIDINNGILYVGKIDRESLNSHPIELVVTATDSGTPPLRGTANLTIRVEDTNDNRPVFGSAHYSFAVKKTVDIGDSVGRVEATDDDAAPPNNVTYYVAEDERFYIDDEGHVIYNGTDVFGKDSVAEFKVWAIDLGEPPLNASAMVIVNENSDAVRGATTTKVNRSSEAGMREVQWANAKMQGYTYEILSATAEGVPDAQVRKWLQIDKLTGVVKTLRRIPVESVKEIKVSIAMRKKRKEIPVELIIKIVDENDNTPFFKRAAYRAVVPEDSAIGTVLMAVEAEGVEAENHVGYSLNVTRGSKNALSIDVNGNIKTTRRLDYEDKNDRNISGVVRATDSLGHKAFANFTLALTDVNDNRPQFANGSVFSVVAAERLPIGAALNLTYPLAFDEDTGSHGRVHYSIIGGEDFFVINEKTSVITIKQELDYERQRTHSLTVRAVDNLGRQPSHEMFASLTVYVEDVNDNPPVIHNADLMHLTATEDLPAGALVTVISVTDADGGGAQSVQVTTNHTVFRVDEQSRLVVAATSLGGYAGEKLCGVLQAVDTGIPPLAVTAPFCVRVHGTSSAIRPLIVHPKPNSIHYFDENETFNHLVQVKVVQQKDSNKDALFTFKLDHSFKKDWELFSIDDNGTLKALAPFDAERKPLHELRINVCNVQRNCTSLNLFISVNDKNDNCPFYSEKEAHLALVENDRSPIPRRIGTLPSASDADAHADNRKTCYATDSQLFFFLNASEPILHTNRSFDREEHNEHLITVTAFDCTLSCDDPTKPVNSTIKVRITVTDLNDNFPRFSERIYYATVIQGQNGPGQHIGKVVATDLDEETEGLKYGIKGVVRTERQTFGAGDSPISVDPKTGAITANDLLREPSYQFTVAVLDAAAHEDTATVIVSVVGYDQQAELLFDAPFEYIVRNERNINRLLSASTPYTAVIDRCRQHSNFTIVLAHFLDHDGKFVQIDHAIQALMKSESSARSELRTAYGLREAASNSPHRGKIVEAVVVGGTCAMLVLLISLLFVWCRQKEDYSRKLRVLSATHTRIASLQHDSGSSKKPVGGLYWEAGPNHGAGTLRPMSAQGPGPGLAPTPGPGAGLMRTPRSPPAPPPLQSTEL